MPLVGSCIPPMLHKYAEFLPTICPTGGQRRMHTPRLDSSKQQTGLEKTPPNSAGKSHLKILTGIWEDRRVIHDRRAATLERFGTVAEAGFAHLEKPLESTA